MMKTTEMSADSRAWVYQSNKELTSEEASQLKIKAAEFVKGWTAHDTQLKAASEIIYNRFLVLMVDEKQAKASGCSIDKSVKFVKEMELAFDITLLDRMHLAYKRGDQVLSCSKEEFEELMRKGEINDDTIVFNNLVSTVRELTCDWELPVARSWHRNLISKY